MTRPSVVVIAFVAVVAACDRELPPRGQIVLHVVTDAVAPPAPDAPPSGPTRLGTMVDRALFEIRVDGAPVPGAERTFAIDEGVLRDDRLSIGILPPPGASGVSVRVRLFRADRVASAEPPPGVTLDTTVTLPAVAEEGITHVSVVLRTEDFGKRIGPVPASAGITPHAAAPTYRGGRKVRCTGTTGPGEVCVPGGTFFFGNPAFRGRTPSNDIYEERLVEVSPFYLDRTEVTVGAFRKLWPKLEARGLPPPRAWSGVRTRDVDEANWCTFGPPDANAGGILLDDLPLSCVSWATARAYCQELGKDLPTEAEFEYVSSGLGAEWSFPWGEAEPTCGDAVWGRGGVGLFELLPSTCRDVASTGWPGYPGTGAADRLSNDVLGNGSPEEIVDVAGNLGEWMLDVWARQSDSAWRSLERVVDPRAAVPSEVDGDARVARGGDWTTSTLALRGGYRVKRLPSDDSSRVGFRCRRRGNE